MTFMRFARLSPAILIAIALSLSACGADSEAVEPVSWPYLESTEPLTINGKEFKAYIASTEQHRRRAINGLAVKPGQAIAMLYPKLKDPVEIKFNTVPDPMELVFVGDDGKAVLIENVPAFAYPTFPRTYGGKHARIVLQLPKGTAKELSIAVGADVKTSPDLLQKSNDAERQFARVYFLRNERPEDKPESSPYVSLRPLKDAEDVAQLMQDRDDLKEGEGVIVNTGSQFHQFWLKGVKGKVCAAWLESVSSGRAHLLAGVYEGIEAADAGDLDQPVYCSAGKPAYLAIWKGGDFFAVNKIEKRSAVTVVGMDESTFEKPDYSKIELKFGDSTIKAALAATEDARAAALHKAATLEADEAFVLAWDDPSFVEIDAPAGANLWFVGLDNKIAHKEQAAGGEVEHKATSRFVLVMPSGFEGKGDFTLPYVLRDLKPSLPAVVFYQAKQKDVVTDRWPEKKDNFKARARVELAITPAEQRRGLMFRESLKTNHGMLFIYPEEDSDLSYWMKNCLMNLSIAFIDDRGVIVKIHNVMTKPAPGTPDGMLELYPAGQPARFAVEMEENWFKNNNIVEGDRIFIPSELIEKK
jgi:hypothetical protein